VVASFAGLGAVIVASSLLVPSTGIVAVPLGYAVGMIVKDILLTLFLVPRVRRIGVSSPA
jgi:hypothetical protein